MYNCTAFVGDIAENVKLLYVPVFLKLTLHSLLKIDTIVAIAWFISGEISFVTLINLRLKKA